MACGLSVAIAALIISGLAGAVLSVAVFRVISIATSEDLLLG
jgi:hypothetical protein